MIINKANLFIVFIFLIGFIYSGNIQPGTSASGVSPYSLHSQKEKSKKQIFHRYQYRISLSVVCSSKEANEALPVHSIFAFTLSPLKALHSSFENPSITLLLGSKKFHFHFSRDIGIDKEVRTVKFQ